MLTRRAFPSGLSCAICAITAELMATDAETQTPPPAATTGRATGTLRPGDGFQIPPNTPHAGGKPGPAKTRVLITYVVEKGKPLASPA